MDVLFPLFRRRLLFFFYFLIIISSPSPPPPPHPKRKIVLNVWDSGNYTAGRDDDEGGTAGWTELGPLLDAHSWGGGREHSRPKVRTPK